jgi:hypothetical protein
VQNACQDAGFLEAGGVAQVHKANKCTDEKTYQAMSTKSKLLLQEIMATSKSMDSGGPELRENGF